MRIVYENRHAILPEVQSEVKEKKNPKIPIYFNINYRKEIKLVLMKMEYCLLQFYALKFFLGISIHEGSLPNFNFFNVNRQIFQRNSQVHPTNYPETNFHNIFSISLRNIKK